MHVMHVRTFCPRCLGFSFAAFAVFAAASPSVLFNIDFAAGLLFVVPVKSTICKGTRTRTRPVETRSKHALNPVYKSLSPYLIRKVVQLDAWLLHTQQDRFRYVHRELDSLMSRHDVYGGDIIGVKLDIVDARSNSCYL